jgi:uncharacterized membrane protein YdjX (TVP38/TMEM64 family)
VLIGVAIQWSGVVDWRAALAWARGMAGWQLAIGIVALQVLLYTLAQPGSALFWVAALVYSPEVATLILTTGGTLGALGAYALARRTVSAERLPAAVRERLVAEGDFFALCMLRLVPGMPHSVLNYGAGVLRLPLTAFLLSTVAGLAVKSYVYVVPVHALAESASPAALADWRVLGPLAGLALVMGMGHWWRRRGARAGRNNEQ